MTQKNAVQSGIYLSQVIAEYRASGLSSGSPYFSVAYRKTDGSFGEKQRVRRRAGDNPDPPKSDLASIRHQNRQAGKLHLITDEGHRFELHIPLLVSFNGKLIDHRF